MTSRKETISARFTLPDTIAALLTQYVVVVTFDEATPPRTEEEGQPTQDSQADEFAEAGLVIMLGSRKPLDHGNTAANQQESHKCRQIDHEDI